MLNGCDKTPRAGQGGWQPQEGTAGIEGSCSAVKWQRTILKDGLDGAQPWTEHVATSAPEGKSKNNFLFPSLPDHLQ